MRYYKDAANLFGYELIARSAYAQRYLEMMAGDPRKRDGKVATRSRVGDAASEIIATAHEANVDLIVMATHGRGGLARVLPGSVAAEVLRRAGSPVMLIRPAALHYRTEAAPELPCVEPVAMSPAR